MTNEPDDDQLSPFERTLAAQLREVGGGFQPDPEALADGALRRGRSRLWRRRAATATGAAAVAGIAVFATQLPGGSGEAADRGGVAAPPGVPETGAELTAAVSGMLPEDARVTRTSAVGVDQAADPAALFVLEAGETSYTLEVALSRRVTEDWGAHAGCPALAPDEARCEEEELPDGSLRSVTEAQLEAHSFDLVGQDGDGGASESGDDGPLHTEGRRSWTVWVDAPTSWGPGEDGLRRLTIDLATTEPSASATPGVPPLSEAELVSLSAEPLWPLLFDRVDALHGAPGESLDTGPRADVPAVEVRTLFQELAPDGLTITDRPDETPGGATLTVADGVASARIEIGAYPSGSVDPGERDEEPAEDCQRETRADGTRTVVCAGDQHGGATSVVVHYPDDASLVILVSPPVGGEPPLSEDQLLGIAGDPAWPALLR
ncbi:hypothetical protein SAMN06297387_106139 [Streptomyces zhaozhouensis]|uniref:Uncharacterized protein n=1 Tax=Streptomyces zhaozhouensis TaxID=1300267 RepID=A0A286DV81_9ACTN|nr:hypothetical protein [Streptomyces zhaozhouensis]SOD62562.1 hypothetical protein SAMN06297387_106139 [Streptomyces zhaozhouensis]